MGRRVAERARLVAEAHEAPLRLVHVTESPGEAMIEPGLARLMREHQHESAESLREWLASRSDGEITLDVTKGSPSWELVAASKKADMVVVGSSTIDAFTVGPTARRVAEMSGSDTLVVRRQPRVPYRRVVVAVDFSEASRGAVTRAKALFPEADLTVLYSLPSRFDLVLANAGLFAEEVDASRGYRLEAAADRMAEFAHEWNGTLSTVIADGPPTETVDEVVRRRNADLVVVGNRGASATRMVLLGTVAEGLLAQAPCDVLVARAPGQFRRP